MGNARRLRQSLRPGAIALGAAVTLASAAFTITPAGAAPSPSAQPARSGLGVPAVPHVLSVRPDMLFAGSNELDGVFCASAASCLAVGLHAAKTGALINETVRWNGRKWSKVSVPSPAGTGSGDFSTLSAVRCTSSADCWAVGSDANLGQALHWNGAKWSLVPTPEPGGTSGFTELRDVVCLSARSCWAVGLYGQDGVGGETSFDLALHWNGKKWIKVTAPSPAGTQVNDVNALDAVRCGSPDNCWAAGWKGVGGLTEATSVLLNNMLHWNGRKWLTRTVPSPGGTTMGSDNTIFGLSCTSATNCWAVGQSSRSGAGNDLNQALHWNGRKWSSIAVPNPDGTAMGADNNLNSVNCTAKNNCWAVGDIGTRSTGGSVTGQALHWNGIKWKRIATPNPAGTTNQALNSLNSVRCVTAKNCWIVGDSQVNDHPDVNLFLHWNGAKWSVG